MFINILFDVLFVIYRIVIWTLLQLYQWNFFDYSAFWINLPYRMTCKFHIMYQWSIYYHTVASSPKQFIYSNSCYILLLVLPIKKKFQTTTIFLTNKHWKIQLLIREIFDILLSNILYIDILYAFEIFIRVTLSS